MSIIIHSIDRTYEELITLPTFTERLKYAYLGDRIGDTTFGHDRWLNQRFYSSIDWKRVRDFIIARDLGCNLAYAGAQIVGKIIVHHLNPITKEDILEGTDRLFDPNNLVCVAYDTHNRIHFSTKAETDELIVRTPNDTCPWKGDNI